MVFNRPGVARAVLQSPPLLIHSLSHPSFQISSKHCQSETGRGRELKFGENIHTILSVMCHMSCVTCHMSCVTCHVSPVTCQNFFFLHFYNQKIKNKKPEKMDRVVELVGGGSVINGAYPV